MVNIRTIAHNDKLVMKQEGRFDGCGKIVEGLEDFSGGVFDGEPFVLDQVVLG